jgi:hypothetical protein
MHPAFQKIQDAKASYEKMVLEAGEAAIKELLNDFLTKHPEAEGIEWEQYTPYFNDGEPCVFNVYEPKVLIGDEALDTYDLGDGHQALEQSLRDLGRDIDANADALLVVFGDHMKVTATRAGISTDTTDHD